MELLHFSWIYFPTKVIWPADVLEKLGAYCTWASHGKWFWLLTFSNLSLRAQQRRLRSWHTQKHKPLTCAWSGNSRPRAHHFQQAFGPVTLGATKQCHHLPKSLKKCWEDMESLRISYPTRGWYEVPEAHLEYLYIYFLIQPITMLFTTRNRIISVSNPRDETALETHKATQKNASLEFRSSYITLKPSLQESCFHSDT